MNAHFDLLAPFYDRLIPPPEAGQLRRLLRLPAEGWLLDVGGGTGRVATQLAPFTDRLVICDLSSSMLGQARTKGVACPVQAGAEDLPFPDGHFDRVVVVDALHHFRHQPASIDELLRVLKPGGRLVIEEPDIRHLPVKLIALVEKMALMGSRFYTPVAIQGMIEAHGHRADIETDGRFAAWIVTDKEPR